MTEINSNLTIEEAEQFAEVLTAEAEAHVVNDEIDAYKMKEELEQVAETFDALDAEGVEVKPMSPEDYDRERQMKSFQEQMGKMMSARENHTPGKEHIHSDGQVYIATGKINNKPGALASWVKKEKEIITNPNLKNKSVRRKLKNTKKYQVINTH